MRRAKKILKYLLKAIVGFIGLVLLYFILALILSHLTFEGEKASRRDISIYILTNGVHTDLVMPVQTDLFNWRKLILLPAEASQNPDFKYIGIGMGEKTFYIDTKDWQDLQLSTAAQAGFGFGTTAMHTTYYKNVQVGPDCRQIWLSREQYKKLIAFVLQSLKRKDGNPVSLNASYHENDAFYAGDFPYSVFYTCNTWVNEGLKRAGQKYCLWTPFEKPLFRMYSIQR